HTIDASGRQCASGVASNFATNLHFHGLNIPPICHQDDVLHTLIQPNDGAFKYHFKIPADQPPGLYWYHPHAHGWSEAQVLGGASGAIIVEGIEHAQPETAGLPERLLILRDQLEGEKPPEPAEKDEVPNPALGLVPLERDEKDISINFVPILLAHNVPAILNVRS